MIEKSENMTDSQPTLSVEERRDWTSDSFVEVLRERAEDTVGQRKGERRRRKLRAAAAAALVEIGYRDMTVADICRGADATPAVLYLHYESKLAIVLDVLTEFMNEFFATAKSPRSDSLFEAIRLANLRWIRLGRANAGLIRCLIAASAEEPEFARLYADANLKWYQRSVAVWEARFAKGAFDKRAALLSAYALGGLLDEIVRLLFVAPSPPFQALVAELGMDDEDIAEYVTLIWYRALTGRDHVRPESRVGELFTTLRERRIAKPRAEAETASG